MDNIRKISFQLIANSLTCHLPYVKYCYEIQSRKNIKHYSKTIVTNTKINDLKTI